ncbi:glycoside hydrolase family 3 N-terminal domain-containing protein [Arthrobacter sp. UYEF3]|uniref:glycoside hydrolase family 3 N-terminal domain-containing protein n=1 Tax=Arthrobacter sp. UYEF3 TaxID=1756365 RepID=UPI003394FE0B
MAATLALLTGLAAGSAGCSVPGSSGPGPTPDQSSTAGPTPASDPRPAKPLGWGPDQNDAEAAGKAVAGMSLEQKAGQVLLPFFAGLDAEAHAGIAERLHLAGSIVLGDNVRATPYGQVTMGPADPTIGSRSISGSADTAAEFGAAFSRGMLDSGVLPAAKHFPGHGSVTVNSHEGLPVQSASLEQLRAKDLKPFQAAIDAGLPMVMTGHIAVPALQPGVPASVSKAAYAELRRMGFKGVAVTDAMNMGAIERQFPDDAAAPLALAAGADLVLMPASVETAHAAIVSAVRSGSLPAARLDEVAQRVATMQLWRARSHPPEGRASGSGAALSEKVSQEAITVVAGPCRGPIVPASVRVSGGTEQDRARFAAAAKEAGVGIGNGPLVTLIGYGGSPAAADVAVALDAPWPLEKSAAPAKIALYGRSQEAFDVLLAVLAGRATALGKLPVAVGPHGPGSGCG